MQHMTKEAIEIRKQKMQEDSRMIKWMKDPAKLRIINVLCQMEADDQK